jgi:2-oxoacid:acceptor oxidoreductase gamma subunit (pyruvate/2-ketoisovalerate family)/2-oxoacid:acceptor oxidoreductase delta subunit (pyruvate/2-ketoisovalerate family)
MLIVGRGGQGVVLASQLLADTFARAGFWVQSFPEFRAERRGAPIQAFLRWDGAGPIHRRYKLHDCDVLVAVTATPPPPEAFARVRPGGLVVLNRDARYRHSGPWAIARVPASRIARDHGILSAEGRPMGNVAMLGACVALLLPGGLELLEQAISARMGGRSEANILAARQGHAHCTRQYTVAGDTPVGDAPTAAASRSPTIFPISTTDSLLNHTGSWSEERPVLAPACNSCALCALFCPEGAIARVDGSMVVDYLYCKGCGICELVCPVRDAVEMEEVPA